MHTNDMPNSIEVTIVAVRRGRSYFVVDKTGAPLARLSKPLLDAIGVHGDADSAMSAGDWLHVADRIARKVTRIDARRAHPWSRKIQSLTQSLKRRKSRQRTVKGKSGRRRVTECNDWNEAVRRILALLAGRRRYDAVRKSPWKWKCERIAGRLASRDAEE